jgi:hypothetical protein
VRANVYKNLKRGDWSVTDSENPRRKGIVKSHVGTVTLRDCVFYVSEATRQTVIRKGERSVHAWINGEIQEGSVELSGLRAISYNPYKGGRFYYRDNGEGLESASLVYFSEKEGAFAL